jgi:predicted metalloprotease with PDZ domain
MKVAVSIAISIIAVTLRAETARYEVRYDGGPTIHVKASLPAGDGRLLIAKGGGIDHLPDQWATFVKSVRVTSGGSGIAAAPAGKEGWTLPASGALELEYDVSLEYADGQWPAGNEQAGRRFPNALFTVTKTLFVYTSGTTDARVRFVVPAGGNVAVPWERGTDGEYRAPNVASLTNNAIVMGTFPSTNVKVGAFDVTVATPGMPVTPPLLAKALAQIGALATDLFDKTPPGKYVMTFFAEPSEDGESYESSAAITSPAPFDTVGMIVTGNTLVHELLHHWFGGQLAPAEHDSIAWFTEGFTEYYANVAVARSGAVPQDVMLKKIANMTSGYLYFHESSLFSGVPLGDAGKRKGAYRFGVYNGGWAIALSLDVLIREETRGKKSLDDVVRLLYTTHSGKPITLADIASAASTVAGRDLSDFFQTYVVKRNELPLAETLMKLGLDLRGQPYAADIYIVPVASPTAAQSSMRQRIFGKR